MHGPAEETGQKSSPSQDHHAAVAFADSGPPICRCDTNGSPGMPAHGAGGAGGDGGGGPGDGPGPTTAPQ